MKAEFLYTFRHKLQEDAQVIKTSVQAKEGKKTTSSRNLSLWWQAVRTFPIDMILKMWCISVKNVVALATGKRSTVSELKIRKTFITHMIKK